jgi:formamidopyrimidine-DNA glycosylase
VPELPEVETVVRDLCALGLVGRKITGAEVHWERTVAGMRPPRFVRLLKGRRFLTLSRRAKYIVAGLTGGWTLLIHLRMTGQFRVVGRGVPREGHEHLVVRLDDGRDLRFRDTRKFGRWLLTREPDQALGALGPEPLGPEFRAAQFAAGLRRHARQLKPLLLDQTFVAGLGNIYADEALWEARLHPLRLSASLSRAEALGLYRAIRRVLRAGIRNRGTSLGAGRSNFYTVSGERGRHQERVKVFRRTGAPCPRCGGAIRRLLVAQRSTHVCPRCQHVKCAAAKRKGCAAEGSGVAAAATVKPPWP